MKRLLVLLTALAVTLSLAGCGADTKEGRTGDTMATYFFEFTVNSAALTNDYEGYTPAEGNALLVAEVTVKNTFKESIEMIWSLRSPWDRRISPSVIGRCLTTALKRARAETPTLSTLPPRRWRSEPATRNETMKAPPRGIAAALLHQIYQIRVAK